MIHYAALAAAFALSVSDVPQETPPDKKDTVGSPFVCPTHQEPGFCLVEPKGLPQELIFDPRVPQEPRSEEPDKTMPVLTNPSTVTLSPVPVPSTKSKEKTNE